MKHVILGAALMGAVACATENDTGTKAADAAAKPEVTNERPHMLTAILAAQPEEAQARYQYRNPKETIEFFEIRSGMTVVDILPGGGWYTKILLPYLGSDGQVIGVDYAPEMWALFGGFANEEFLEAKKTWPQTWTAQASEWRTTEGGAGVSAFALGAVPAEAAGTVDAVMMVRAFHHLNRFEEEGGYRTAALKELYDVVKPGGVVGIVQHRAPEDADDTWAEGDNGYVKQSLVIETMEAAGFVLEQASEINANPKDQPTSEDVVWRLPPSLGTSRDNEELRAEMTAIGESDRMTLRFRKPA